MTQSARKLIEGVLALPEDEMEEVVEAILDRLHPASRTSIELDSELREVVASRIGELERGEVEVIPWDDVRAQGRKLREELSKK